VGLLKYLFGDERGGGESPAHHRAKVAIHDALSARRGVADVRLERQLGSSRPDVSAIVGGQKVAFEVQISALGADDLARRTRELARRGIAVVWLLPERHPERGRRYAPAAWERYLHALGGGRVYYWLGGLRVQPVHLAECQLRVDPRAWRGPGGEVRHAGGYDRASKRYRIPLFGREVDLVDDFRVCARPAWECPTLSIPACLVYRDAQPRWW